MSLLRCLDLECSRVQRVKLDTAQVTPPMTALPGVKEISIKNVLERPDGRPLVLAEWLTFHLADDGWDDQMVLYSCDDAACSSVTTQVVMDGANYWSGSLLPDGSLAIAYQTGRQVLCDVLGCADPERTDLSSLELLLCPDPDDCSVGSGRIVVLDRIGMLGLGGWQGGGVIVGAEGAPAVLYTREVGPDVSAVRLAQCTDARCSDVTTATVLEPELADLGLAAAMPDGSPVFIRSRFSEQHHDFSLVVCADAACSTSSAPIVLEQPPGQAGDWLAGFAVTPDAGVVVAVLDFPAQQLRVLSCPNRDCGAPERSPVLAQLDSSGLGSPRLRLAPDGRPMFTVEFGASEMGEEEHILYVACDDPACSSATTATLDDPALTVEEWEADAALGLMMHPHNTRWS